MKYVIVAKDYSFDLEDAVNKRIEMGYKPQGGIFVVHGLWCQAMIRETEA